MAPKLHVVRQGECLSSIAALYGFADPISLYSHAENEQLRRARPNPNVLFPGDRVAIPEPQAKVVHLQTGKRHQIVISTPKTRFRLALDVIGEGAKGFAGKPFLLELDGLQIKGNVNEDGLIDVLIPASAEAGRLSLWADPTEEPVLRLDVALGHLDPPDTTTGAKARLLNLGYYNGDIDEARSQAMVDALKRFQRKEGLVETGALDATVAARLRAAHDGV